MPPIKFPERTAPIVALTPKMLDAQDRLFAVHKPRGQFLVLTGPAGAGKTVAALHLADRINTAHAGGALNSFAAAYYVASDWRKPTNSLMLQRMVFLEFAQQVLRLTVPKDTRSVNLPVLKDSIAAGLRLRNIQTVFIDEAGHIPPSGLDHLLALINNVATGERHPLTIVLVGMDDLPLNTQVLPQVSRRVTTVYFTPYDAATVLPILQVVHPFFKTVNLKTTEGAELMEFLLSPSVSRGGLIGYIVPLVEQAAAMAPAMSMPFGLRLLRVAHATAVNASTTAQAAAKRAWADTVPSTTRTRSSVAKGTV